MTTAPPPSAPLAPEQVQLVQDSFGRVAPAADAVADAFYDRLFERAPDARALFPDDMAEQKRKLMQMLGMAVGSLHQPDRVVPVLADLGARHAGYGVEQHHYGDVGGALLDTLEAGLGDDWTPDVRDAWVATWTVVAGVMQEAQAAAGESSG